VTLYKKPTLFISRPIAGVEHLRDNYPQINILMNPREENLSREELTTQARASSALITMLCDPIDKAFLESNSHLKVISNYAVGLNNIDLNCAAKLGIKIGHTPDILTHSTAETAIMMLLNLSRKFNQVSLAVKEGNWRTWEPTLFNGEDLREKKIGIIGFGRIGRNFAEKAFALWKTPILVLKRQSYKSLDLTFPYSLVDEEEFFKEVDILSLHCPLTQETQNMINSSFIQRMKKPFYFLNTARGQIHCEQDLLEGLKAHKLKGIGLDVTNPEPMENTNELLTHPRAIVLPHIGSATDRTRFEMTEICLRNILAGLNNERLPCDAFS
jgi:glyoxylate reductase